MDSIKHAFTVGAALSAVSLFLGTYATIPAAGWYVCALLLLRSEMWTIPGSAKQWASDISASVVFAALPLAIAVSRFQAGELPDLAVAGASMPVFLGVGFIAAVNFFEPLADRIELLVSDRRHAAATRLQEPLRPQGHTPATAPEAAGIRLAGRWKTQTPTN